MNYSLGCAFRLNEILMNFPLNKLLINSYECEKITGDKHRLLLVKKIFKASIKLVLNDIIDNNITFWLPLTGQRSCNMHMARIRGKEFLALRKGGKWKDVDITKSSFSGCEIRFFMLGKRTPRIKVVYLNKEYRDRISLNTNQGKAYGDGKIDKTIIDYYDIILSLFPTVSMSDIKRILTYSWKVLYLHNSYGGDTLIKDSTMWFYIGNLKKDPIKHFLYYINKLSIRLRVLYRKKKIPWDGYYYFALTEKLYLEYISKKKKRGRPKKWFTFEKLTLYQLLDECKLQEWNKRYIFRIPYISYLRFTYYALHITTDKAELIITREPLKFKDILVSTNEYEIL